MLLKGKTIPNVQTAQNISDEINTFGIRNTTQTSAPTLMPKKIVNACASVEPIHNIKSTKIISTLSELEFDKTIIKNEKIPNEIVKRTKNLRYNLNELKEKFPEHNKYSSLYYQEIFDLLESTDFNLDENNLNLNLQKFIHLGNNVQSQISRLHSNLEIISCKNYNQIKNKICAEIGFFTSNHEYEKLFEEFNFQVQIYYTQTCVDIDKLKNIDFNKYNLINFYFDFFKFICAELEIKEIASSDFVANSVLSSRVISLNNSKIVLEQFKQLLALEINGKDIELNNLKNYLHILKPSLCTLQLRDFKAFKEQFKEILK